MEVGNNTYQVVTLGDDKWTGEAVFFTVGDYKTADVSSNFAL